VSTVYTNLPSSINNKNNFGQQAFINFFGSPLEVDSTTFDGVKSFFTSKGFDESASASFASMIIFQAKKDNVNPMSIVDLLKGTSDIQLNSLMAEIINYNRFKTSYLGFGPIFSPNPDVSRNILP
jgi:hypothetical protein